MSNIRRLNEPVESSFRWKGITSSFNLQDVTSTSELFYPLSVDNFIETIKEHNSRLLVAELWPVNFCNNKCSFCSSDIFSLKNEDFLSITKCEEIIHEAKDLGCRLIRISGGGEPFLLKGMEKLIRFISDEDMSSLYITNGTVLRGKVLKSLALYANAVRISLSAGSKKNYIKVHGRDSFLKVMDSMSQLVNLREKYDRKDDLLLGINFVLTKDNYNFMSKTARLVKNIGFDFMLIRGLNPTRPIFTGNEKDELVNELEKCSLLVDKNFFVYANAQKLDGSRGHKPPYTKCYSCNYRLFINSNGSIYPCFSSILFNTDSYGNVNSQPLKAIWKNKVHRDLMRNLNNGLHRSFCNEFCDKVEFNSFVDFVKENLGKDKNVKFKQIPRNKSFCSDYDWIQ